MKFTDLFGNTPRVKVIELFIRNPDKYYNKSDIRRLTGVSRTTLQELCKDLIRIGLVKKSGIQYKLRKYNKIAQMFIKLLVMFNQD